MALRKHSKRRAGAAVFICCIFIFLLMLLPAFARAQSQPVYLSTPFPGIAALPGERINFLVNANNETDAGKTVTLSLAEAPAGWSALIKGRGSEVHKVFVQAHGQERLDLEVSVPDDVGPGDYRLLLEGEADTGKFFLPVSIRIKERGEPAVRLTTDYPVLQGPAGAEFKYRVSLINDSTHEQMFSLIADVPAGWSAVFQPSHRSEQIASISLDAGATQGLDLILKSPRLIAAGEHPINIRAVGSLAAASLELKAVITGTYELNLTTPTGRLSARARAGEETPLVLLLENRGSSALRNISLAATLPPNWQVSFEPEELDLLQAGQSVEVTARLRPDAKAIAGDYVATFRARSDETSVSRDFRLTILTPTLWGVVGVGAVLAALGGIFVVFKLYGRR